VSGSEREPSVAHTVDRGWAPALTRGGGPRSRPERRQPEAATRGGDRARMTSVAQATTTSVADRGQRPAAAWAGGRADAWVDGRLGTRGRWPGEGGGQEAVGAWRATKTGYGSRGTGVGTRFGLSSFTSVGQSQPTEVITVISVDLQPAGGSYGNFRRLALADENRLSSVGFLNCR
jgi:hypothetical protein